MNMIFIKNIKVSCQNSKVNFKEISKTIKEYIDYANTDILLSKIKLSNPIDYIKDFSHFLYIMVGHSGNIYEKYKDKSIDITVDYVCFKDIAHDVRGFAALDRIRPIIEKIKLKNRINFTGKIEVDNLYDFLHKMIEYKNTSFKKRIDKKLDIYKLLEDKKLIKTKQNLLNRQ